MPILPKKPTSRYAHLHDEWERLYVKEGLSSHKLAERFGVSTPTVLTALRERGVNRNLSAASLNRYGPISERFAERVKRSADGCWEWGGPLRADGYAQVAMGVASGTTTYAHRLSYELHYGSFDPKMNVCHTCDNRACVRPDHLFLGTGQDNVDDMVSKGRHAHGERHSRAKLTEADVREARRLHATGKHPKRQLAIKYGVSDVAMGHAIRGITWRHVD